MHQQYCYKYYCYTQCLYGEEGFQLTDIVCLSNELERARRDEMRRSRKEDGAKTRLNIHQQRAVKSAKRRDQDLSLATFKGTLFTHLLLSSTIYYYYYYNYYVYNTFPLLLLLFYSSIHSFFYIANSNMNPSTRREVLLNQWNQWICKEN